ncbi:MAG: ComEC/Rec2 family competence protein [Bacteroidota bacterium]
MLPNWHAVPFLRVCMPFISGITIAFHFGKPSTWPLCILLAGLGLLCILFAHRIPYRWRWVFGWITTISFFFIGYQSTSYFDETVSNIHFSHTRETNLTLIGKVYKIKERKNGNQYYLKLLSRFNGKDHKNVTGNLSVYFKGDSSIQRPKFGDLVILSGMVSGINRPKNPKQFDYARYMHFQNVHYQAYIKPSHWAILGQNPQKNIRKISIALRDRFLDMLESRVKLERERGVANALLLGWKSEIDENVIQAYRNTGAAHVLAVSGLHVGLIFLILNTFLKKLRKKAMLPRLIRMSLLLIGIWTYALITGASPSVQRAAAMLSFVIIGQTLQRQNNIFNTLAVSAFCVLLVNPYLLSSPGFQLSYIAVIGIVFFQPRIFKLLSFRNPLLSKIWALMAVSLAAQLVTSPLSIYYFHQFPFFFWLTGIIVVPITAAIMPVGVALFVFGEIDRIGVFLGDLLNAMLYFMNYAVMTIESFPDAVIDGIWMSPLTLILCYTSMLGIMALITTRSPRWWFVPIGCLLTISFTSAYHTITMMDKRTLYVYSLHQSFQSDLIIGKTAYSFNQSINTKGKIPESNWIVEQFRDALGIQSLTALSLHNDYHDENLYSRSGIIFTPELKLAFINKDYKPGSIQPLSLNGIIITEKVADIASVLDDFSMDWLVDNGNRSFYHKEKFSELCRDRIIEYHNLRFDGAFILEIQEKNKE